jgi:hypothetical protein
LAAHIEGDETIIWIMPAAGMANILFAGSHKRGYKFACSDQ